MSKFKVGDKVKILKDDYRQTDVKKGDILTVSETWNNNGTETIRAVATGKTSTWRFDDTDGFKYLKKLGEPILDCDDKELVRFSATTQCEKLEAFKKALVKLLNKEVNMKIGMDDVKGAEKFVDYVKEHTQGYEQTYQKFMDLVSDLNYRMLARFTEEETESDEMAKDLGGEV